MRRFFISHLSEDSVFELPEEESKHIVRVLRMIKGDQFLLLNGIGLILTVVIVEDHPKRCKVEVLSKEMKSQPTGFHLAIAPTKNIDRLEWMVEKIVEIGATELTFLQCDHSERLQLKIDRLERVAISAMKQAQNDFLLRIHPLIRMDEFLLQFPNGGIAHCAEGEKIAIGQSQFTGPILIGPEGDFSSREIDLALKNGYEAIHLGQTRLRTETAGVVASVLSLTARVI